MATSSRPDTRDAPPGGVVLSEELSISMAEMFRALADPSRAKIVHALTHEDMTTSGLAARLGMSAPLVSQHLRLLRMLRIVRPHRDGRLVFYSLDDAHIRLLITLSLTHLAETGGHGQVTQLVRESQGDDAPKGEP